MRHLRSMVVRRVAAAGAALALAGACTGEPERAGPVTLTIGDNSAVGGRNGHTARWIVDYVVPNFERSMRKRGRDVRVVFKSAGIDDEDYRQALELELRDGRGPDIIGFDQFWLARFASQGLLEPLTEVVGNDVNAWEGWSDIPLPVRLGLEFGGQIYGVPSGTDGRVLFYNSELFARAGLPEQWQPDGWSDILEAAATLRRKLPGVVPFQLNAGVSMGEATTLQGFMPILLGAGESIFDESTRRWLGDGPALRTALRFYDTVYERGYADADLQIGPTAREHTFERFADGEIAIILESDFLYRSVIAPTEDALYPMPERDEVVRWALIPARRPGAGIRGQDFVSASGGGGATVNPNSDNPDLAWELLTFMNTTEAASDLLRREPRIMARGAVNRLGVVDDPLLEFIARDVLPITWFRPGFPEYPEASAEIARMVEAVATGQSSVAEAASAYDGRLREIVGDDAVRP